MALPSSLIRPLQSRNVLLTAGVIALIYLLFQIFFLNFLLISQTVGGQFPLAYKLSLLLSLFTGYFAMFPLRELIFSLMYAVLVGINVALVIALMQNVKRSGNAKFSFGGVGLLAFASTGCPSCGLSLLSLLGPSTGILGVALHSPLIQIAMTSLLLISIWYSLRRLEESVVCRVTPSKKS